MITAFLESDVVSNALGKSLTSAQKAELVDRINLYMTTLGDVAAIKDNPKKAWSAAGSLVEATVKTLKYDSGITNQTAAKAFDVTAEAANIAITCYAEKNVRTLSADCFERTANYTLSRMYEIGIYSAALWEIGSVTTHANEYKVAGLVLAEKYRYGGPVQAFAANGISWTPGSGSLAARRAMDALAYKLARDNGLALTDLTGLPFADSYSRIYDLVVSYERSINEIYPDYLDGSYGRCSNVSVTSPFPSGQLGPSYFASENQTLNYTASSTGAVYQYVFSWGDGSYTVSDLPAAQHGYTTAGYYGVSMVPAVKKIDGEIQVCKLAGSSAISVRGSLSVSSITPSTATLNQATTFTVSGTNLPLTATLAIADAVCVAPTGNTSTGFTQVCTPKATGSKGVTVKTASGGSTIDASRSITVSAVPVVAATGKLNDTGITRGGYDAAGNYVSTCAAAAPGNDCNTGRDATSNDPADGPAGFSFTKIAADGTALPASATSWSCVKDNVTGLIWENKTAANGSPTYTNYDNPAIYSQAQIDASSNSVGYKNAVNQATLCGANDWRLPTVEELQGIVDYSVAAPGPTIAASWFPNTQQSEYWSSSPYAGYSVRALVVDFNYGAVSDYYRYDYYAVRLVRAGQ